MTERSGLSASSFASHQVQAKPSWLWRAREKCLLAVMFCKSFNASELLLRNRWVRRICRDGPCFSGIHLDRFLVSTLVEIWGFSVISISLCCFGSPARSLIMSIFSATATSTWKQRNQQPGGPRSPLEWWGCSTVASNARC